MNEPPFQDVMPARAGGQTLLHPHEGGNELTESAARTKPGRTRRLILLAGTLLLAGLLAVPASGLALASPESQSPPPGDDLLLVNQGEEIIKRKKKGEIEAKPIFNRQVDVLYFALRHPDHGEWLTTMLRVIGGEKEKDEGWEYSIKFPKEDDQFQPHPEETYILVLSAGNEADGDLTTFHAVVPVYQPNGLWDKVLRALDPTRWARAIAGWFIQGAHGTMCGVVEKITGDPIPNCRVDG